MKIARLIMTASVALSLALVAGVGCDSKDKSGGEPAAADAKPDKANALATLESLASALDGKDYDKAADIMLAPAEIPAEQVKQMLPMLVEKQEISVAGVKIMKEKAKFGPLAEVFPDKGERWAKRANVDVANAYGLSYENAEVGLAWKDGKFRIFRLDDIGKLGGS